MKLFRPESWERFTADDARRFLCNFLLEARTISFTPRELDKLLSPKILGRLANPATHDFFLYHFGSLFARAVPALLGAKEPRMHTNEREFRRKEPQVNASERNRKSEERESEAKEPPRTPREPTRNLAPLILDLGCGSGTGSILFALLGARVIGLDLDPALIAACRKRQEFYEAQFGPLSLRFEEADALSFNYAALAPIDAVYSLFAFNLIHPASALLSRLLPALAPGGRIVISDGNRSSFYNRLFRSRAAFTPKELRRALLSCVCGSRADRTVRTDRPGLAVSESFHCLVPPLFTRRRFWFACGRTLERILDRLGLARWFGLSYTMIAQVMGTRCGIVSPPFAEAPP